MYNTSPAMQIPPCQRRHGDVAYYIEWAKSFDSPGVRPSQVFNQAATSTRPSALKSLFRLPYPLFVEPAFFCQTPARVSWGEGCFINHNNVLLGDAPITIGNGVFSGPNCIISSAQIAGFCHPPGAVFIEDNVWLGANVLVLPGVTIGAGAIVGAGSVVSADIAPHTTFYNAPANT